MSDYLAEMRERIEGIPVLEPEQWALASIAESLHTIASALTPPQDATGAGDGANPESRPAEPCPDCGGSGEGGIDGRGPYPCERCSGSGSALTPPQGPGAAPSVPRAADVESTYPPAPAEPSLVSPDRIEAQAEVIAAVRHMAALFTRDALRQSGSQGVPQPGTWWHAAGEAMRAVERLDRLGGASR